MSSLIGNKPNQVPTNGDLGILAFLDEPPLACKAWVNFNGTGTIAIRASGNVSSITDNGTGYYTVNFTTAMPDANYAVSQSTSGGQDGSPSFDDGATNEYQINFSTSSVSVLYRRKTNNSSTSGEYYDPETATVTFFR
jgi:hypothetical protein